MNEPNRYPSYSACVANALTSARQPLDVDELLSRIASQRPVGNSARGAIYRAIDSLFQAVPVGSGRYGWLSRLLQGTVYCHPLTDDEINNGYLLLDELEHSVFFPQFFQHYRPDNRELTISMFGGPTVRAAASIERKTWSLHLGDEFVHWLNEIGAENRDDLVISVVDAFEGRYELRARLREMRDEEAIEQRNIRLALLAEVLVAEDSQVRAVMPTWDLVARLIGRGFYSTTPPTDDLHYVLHEYSMLRFIEGEGYQIDNAALKRYVDHGEAEFDVAKPLNEILSDWNYREFEAKDISIRGRGRRSPQRDGPEEDAYDTRQSESASEEPDQFCSAYAQYLENFAEFNAGETPLDHEQFHLLEAELDLLMQLEAEFSTLLPEQHNRLQSLVQRLYIDPDTLANMDRDRPDDPNLEDPPSWLN